MRNEGLGSWPSRRARMSPGRTAMIFGDRSVTYAELATRITKLAAQLRSRGVAAGDRVGYLGPNHPAFVETMFAAHLLGAVFVPLNFRLTAPEISYMVEDAGIGNLIYGPECAAVASDLTGTRTLSLATEYEDWLAQGSSEPIDVPVSLPDIALILYTSGTTGRPKGAMLTHANLTWNTYNALISVDVGGDEVTLVTAPLFHVAALGQTLLPTFIKGGCAVITSSWDVDQCYDIVQTHRVTLMFGVTTMFAALARSPRWDTADLSSVRTLMCGGAPIPPALIDIYQRRGLVFCQGYGLTETSPGATFVEAADSVRKVGSAGVPVFFTQVRVVRPDSSDTVTGEPGEVLIKGPNVTPGYWGNPDATAAALTEDGWFHSGDVATVDEDGYLYIVDRVKDMFISGGENVYPAEVENVIFTHPAVTEAAVVGVPDEKWGEVGRAFVVCRPGTGLSRAELREFLHTRLAKYKVPVYVDVVAELPRTASGKVKKASLRAAGANIDGVTDKPVKIPGPDHPITVKANPARVVVKLAGQVVADTTDALTLQESNYPAVQYIPRKDVDFALLERTDNQTYCPFKGDASYYSIPSGGDRLTNSVWTYETPYDAVAEIKDHLAFYADRVTIEITD